MNPRLREFWLTVDLRSAGLLRILLGAVLILQWTSRWRWLDRLYTSDGVLPADVLGRLVELSYYLSPLNLAWVDRSPWMVRAVFLAALACYALLLIGWRTRAACLASLVAFVSISHRNPYVLIGADQVLASLLLWVQVLPVGRRLSVDAWRARRRGEPLPRRSAPSVAAVGIVLQLGLIYLLTACWKHGERWLDGTALYYVMQLEQQIHAPAAWFRQAPLGLIRAASYLTLVVEYAALPMFLLPFGRPWPRRIILGALLALHVGIALVLDAGVFSYAMIAGLAILLKEEDWGWLDRWRRRRPAEADAVPVRAGPLTQVLAGTVLLGILLSALIENVVLPRYWPAPLPAAWRTLDRYNLVVRLPRALQLWNMFAPDPPGHDRWWVAVARTESGRQLDPLTGQAPTFERPSWRDGRFDSTWGVYLARSASGVDAHLREPTLVVRRELCRYLARLGQDRLRRQGQSPDDTDEVRSIELHHLRRLTPPPGERQRTTTDRHLLGSYYPAEDRFVPDDEHREVSRWYRPTEDAAPRLLGRGSVQIATGRRDGRWAEWDEDGQEIRAGGFENGRPAGHWTERTADGWRGSGDYVEGLRQGPWALLGADGARSAGDYARGRRTGIWELYYPDGSLRTRSRFVYGVQHGESVTYYPGPGSGEDGPIWKRGEFKNGEQDGVWTSWFRNGARETQGAFRAGKPHGEWTYWHPDGSLARRGRFVDGEQRGVWTSWSDGVEQRQVFADEP